MAHLRTPDELEDGFMIEKFEWSENFSIKCEPIDTQHKHLFELGNMMLKVAGTQENLAKIKGTIVALYDYVKTHFKAEEDYMATIHYPLLTEHHRFHEEIIQRMNSIMKSSSNLDALVYKFKRLLSNWISEHILIEDKKIAAFMQMEENKKIEAPAADEPGGDKKPQLEALP